MEYIFSLMNEIDKWKRFGVIGVNVAIVVVVNVNNNFKREKRKRKKNVVKYYETIHN